MIESGNHMIVRKEKNEMMIEVNAYKAEKRSAGETFTCVLRGNTKEDARKIFRNHKRIG